MISRFHPGSHEQDGLSRGRVYLDTLLHLAVQELECDFVLALLDKGLDINLEAAKCKTPLHIALARYKKDESDQMLSILLANGANTDIDFGGMPLKEFAEISGAGAFFKN